MIFTVPKQKPGQKTAMPDANEADSACIGIVLAGGQSSRMGQDKAKLLHSSQQTMLEFSKNMLNQVGIKNIVISGDNYDVADQAPALGPMEGIKSVYHRYPTAQAFLIMPVDLPLIGQATLAKLKHIGQMSQQACFFSDHFLPLYLPNNHYCQHFFSQQYPSLLCAKNNKNDCDQGKHSTNKSGLSIKQLLSHVPHQAVELKDPQQLLNTNSPAQWQQSQIIARRLAGRASK